MNWYKTSQTQLTAFHISNEKFNAFDFSLTAQGIIWFAKDKNDLVNNKHGASINNTKPIYLYECSINPHKIANWDEYDKYTLDELEQLGYDTIDLDEDMAVLDPKIIKILDIERLS